MENSKKISNIEIVYNDEKLKKIKKKEIAYIRKLIKEAKSDFSQRYKKSKKFKKKYLYGKSLGIALSIINGPKRIKEEREKKLEEFKLLIEQISKMDIIQYLKHIKERKKERKRKGKGRKRRRR